MWQCLDEKIGVEAGWLAGASSELRIDGEFEQNAEVVHSSSLS